MARVATAGRDTTGTPVVSVTSAAPVIRTAVRVEVFAEVEGQPAAVRDFLRAIEEEAPPLARIDRVTTTSVAPVGTAPGNRQLGIMLPYTPLHHLLLAAVARPLVLTSGNASDEPIAYRDGDALRQLAGIANAFLTHDRAIHIRTDDSVSRTFAGRPVLIRRSRGYVPEPITVRAGTDLVRAAVDDLAAGVTQEVIAARFHNGLAALIEDGCVLLRERHGLGTVALSGGVFQNMLLLRRTVSRLEARGFRVLVHSCVPCNDGGISLGQAVVAAAGDRLAAVDH